jgi:putative endonuclease
MRAGAGRDRPHEPAARRRTSAAMPAAYVYLLRCRDGSLYCGWTSDLERRLAAHRAGRASRYTSRLPVQLALALPTDDRRAARREEARIKRLTRAEKLALVAAAPPGAPHAARAAV